MDSLRNVAGFPYGQGVFEEIDQKSANFYQPLVGVGGNITRQVERPLN